MAINIDVRVARAVQRVNDEGLTLVIFKNARTSGDNPIRVNTLTELEDNFVEPATDAAKHELYCAEYLIRAGVNLLCYSTTEVGTIASGDIDDISDIDTLNYKFVLVPYSFVGSSDNLLYTFARDNDVQVFVDLDPTKGSADLTTELDGVTLSSKLEVFVNSGLPQFVSNYVVDTSDFSGAFVGIPASCAVVARKAALMAARKPWVPVAGGINGVIPEFIKLHKKIGTIEKIALQEENLNVLITKMGVGNLLVSQNTQHDYGDNERDPLVRSHVVTMALWLKRELSKMSYRLLAAPNMQKTWNQFSLSATSLLNYMLESDGVENFSVAIGEGITMTKEDINNGIMRVVVNFLPIRVIESVNMNVIIQQAADTYDIVIETGGGF